MFGRPKITNTVSIAEMMHMREEGMSNQQIANRLGISIGAVYSHIGKQPKEMTERNLANKKNRKAKQLPVAESLSAAELPEMPRESFAERCERMRKAEAGETSLDPTWIEKNAHKLIDDELVCTARPEKLAKYAETPSLTTEEPPYIPNLSDRIDEMVSIFGKMVVIEYIRCRLYEMGMGYCPADRDGLLAKLNSLRGGVSLD